MSHLSVRLKNLLKINQLTTYIPYIFGKKTKKSKYKCISSYDCRYWSVVNYYPMRGALTIAYYYPMRGALTKAVLWCVLYHGSDLAHTKQTQHIKRPPQWGLNTYNFFFLLFNLFFLIFSLWRQFSLEPTLPQAKILYVKKFAQVSSIENSSFSSVLQRKNFLLVSNCI